MGARQELPERLAAQHVRAGAGEELVGRVRLAALELLGDERAAEAADVVAHPAFEPAERQMVLPRGRHPAPPQPELPPLDCIRWRADGILAGAARERTRGTMDDY